MSMTGQQFARQGAIKGGLIGAAGLGTVGALLGSAKHNRVTGKERSTKERVIGGLIGGLAGAGPGFSAGTGVGHGVNAVRWNKGFRPAASRPDWLKGAKTQSEGRKIYHGLARKHHPDLGGDPEAFKKITQEWSEHEPMLLKGAMIDAFADELEKIASIGALVGGYAGHRLSGKNLKSQAIGIAGGALAGHLMGKGLGAAKREIIDRQAERERAELYGYTSPPPPTNFY